MNIGTHIIVPVIGLAALATSVVAFAARPQRKAEIDAARVHESLGDDAERIGDTLLALHHWRMSALVFQVSDRWSEAARVCRKAGRALHDAGELKAATKWYLRSVRLGRAFAASPTGAPLRRFPESGRAAP